MTLPPIDPNALVVGAWLWSSYGKDFIQWIAKNVGGATKEKIAGQWDKFNWKSAAQKYRNDLTTQYGTMRILSMTDPVELSGIFTDVYILDKPSARRRYDIQELMRKSSFGDNTIQYGSRQNGVDVVRNNQRLFILGKPGAGKTTLLKYIVLQSIRGNLDTVPILVSLKDWADSGTSLMDYLKHQFEICSFPDALEFIKYILSGGKATVLFDGLDEVNKGQGLLDRMTREVRDFADQYTNSRCVITCRTAAIDYQFDKFSYCELADFTFEQVNIFVKKWFDKDKKKSTKFLEDFSEDDNERLHELARTPLLLTLLCINFDETMSFPVRRADIYNEALDTLMKRWDASRSIKRDENYRVLSLVRKRQMLSRIAAETFTEGIIFIRQNDIERRITKYLQTLPSFNVVEDIDGEAVLKSLEAQHGIIVEISQGIFSFSHLTFQEFFTANYIVSNASEKMIRSFVGNFSDIRWREVMLLTSSLLEIDAADLYFKLLSDEISSLADSDQETIHLVQWAEGKSNAYSRQEQLSMQSLYMFMALSHELIVSTASAILLASDEKLPFAVSSLLGSLPGISEFIAEIRIRIESLHYTLILDRDRVNLIKENCELALLLAKSLSPKISDILVVSDIQEMVKFFEEEFDSVIRSTGEIVNILNEAYISSKAEFTAQKLVEEFEEDEIMQQSMLDVLDETNNRLLKINEMVLDISDKSILYLYNNANRLLSKQGVIHGSALAVGDLIMLSIWTHFDAMGKISHDYPSIIGEDQIETINSFLYILNRSSSSRDINSESKNAIFLGGLTTWDEFFEDTKDLMAIKHGIGEYGKPNQDVLKKYLEANLLFVECLDVATVSDRGLIKNTLTLPPKVLPF